VKGKELEVQATKDEKLTVHNEPKEKKDKD
jgi:hypothetical protein